MRCCVVVFLLFLIACNKPDPNPELKDPIFQDLTKRMKDLEGQITEETKTLEEHKSALAKVAPQTGQNKYAQKRVFDSENRIDKLKQMKKFYEISLESRKQKDNLDYNLALNKGEPWPDPKEYKDYMDQRKGEVVPRTWSYKNRVEELKELEKANAAPKAEGGGH